MIFAHEPTYRESEPMHVMVATDGTIDSDKTADIAARLAGDDGHITVYTVVVVPRGMLDEMRAASGDPAAEKARELSVEYRSEPAGDDPVSHWTGDDSIVARYVKSKVRDRAGALADVFDSMGVNYEVIGEEGENAARSVLAAATSRDADVLCIGTHGLGRFEGLLGSLSTKVSRHAPCSVVLVR